MQNKFELISDDIKRETTTFLSNDELLKLSMASKREWNLFKPLLEKRQLSKLLNHVARGEYDKLVSMLEGNNIRLLCETGPVIDYSGRRFERISPIKYAFWALDKHMWAAMLKCVSQSEKANEILQIILSQYDEVDSEGVTYWLNGKEITEKHFDFDIIKKLQTQIDFIDVQGDDDDWDAINKHWREEIGGAQKLLPMHVVYEYCSGDDFYKKPKFTSKPKSSMQFQNWVTNNFNDNWFCAGSKLGVDFAIMGPYCRITRCSKSSSLRMPLQADLDALKALCKKRTEDFINLKPQLEEQKTVDNHGQIFQL